MKKIIALAIIIMFGTTTVTAKKKPQSIKPQFRIGQTANYEFIVTYDYRNSETDSVMRGYSDYNFGFNHSMRKFGMESGDTIMSRFSLKVLDASAYGYVMELRFLDFKQSSIKFEDDNEAALFNLTLSIFRKTPLNIMFSADLNQCMPIVNEELYNQIIDELISAYRKNRKLLGNKDEPKREELLEMLNDIDNTFLNSMLSYFIPGMDYFRSIYRQTFLPGTYTDGQMPDSLHKDNILYTQTAITAGDGSFTLQSTKEAYVHAQIGSSKDNVDTIMDVDSVDIDSLTTYDTYDYDSDSVVLDTAVLDTAELDTAELDEDYDTAYIDSLENADLVPSTIRKSLKLDKDSWPVSQEETSIIYSKKGVWTDRKLLRRI